MRKLNRRKMEWIVRWKRKGLTNRELADSQRISTRWVRHICSYHDNSGDVPEPKAPGRPRKPIQEEHTRIILAEYQEHMCNALALEVVIERKHKIHIPHNTIQMVISQMAFKYLRFNYKM